MKGLKKLLGGLFKAGEIPYEKAKEMARHKDVAVRMELARREDLKPEILYYLAEDNDAGVRRVIATNSTAPRHADLLLAADADQDVRVGLAEKIALLAPGLSADEQDKIRKMTYAALEILARDQVTKVRQIIAETLKDVADAPAQVIRNLARDAEQLVSTPILEFSPILTTEDLLEIIASDPVHGALFAVSRRRNLDSTIADAIIHTDDVDVIAELLGNKSAQIREQTLDKIIDRAADIDVWHEPLVARPQLPVGAASKLARYVAENLLGILMARHDLDEATAEEVRTIVNRRLQEGVSDEGASVIDDIGTGYLSKAEKLNKVEALNKDVINDALQSGDFEFAAAALVVLSGLSAATVMKAVSDRNAKGIVAISWKAGLPSWVVEQLQLRLCRIPGKDVLIAAEGSDYPLSEDDM
ncbi:MAG TPA: DUF2336 domain-containing protein, partial [Rhodospirillales bacterium]|nr:DUF2336 domain-containing protein [Rhodospirillales bacterium]